MSVRYYLVENNMISTVLKGFVEKRGKKEIIFIGSVYMLYTDLRVFALNIFINMKNTLIKVLP